MSDIDTTTGLDTTGPEGGTDRKAQAKQVIGQAGQALKTEAQSFATLAQERARAEAQKHTQTATRTLGDFANAIRRAGDELQTSDQSPAARLVSQAADGLESLSRNLADKQPEDILNAVRDFGRRNPAAFIGGAVLVGVALGRFVRASETSTQGFQGDVGGEAYPIGETAAYAGSEATGAEALGLAEEEAFDGEAELSGAQSMGGMSQSMGDDLGDLQPSDIEDSTDAAVTPPRAI
jgi:hypothetical protein